MSELDIERLKTDPEYRAERAALARKARKPEPTQQPEPTINKHMSPADRAHWDMMNDWFQRSFIVSFDDLLEPYTKAHFRALNEVITKQNAELADLHAKVEGLTRLALDGDADRTTKRIQELCEGVKLTWQDKLFALGVDDDEDGDDPKPKEAFKSIFTFTEMPKPPQQEPPTEKPLSQSPWFLKWLRAKG